MVSSTFKIREAQIFENTPQVWRQLPQPYPKVPTMMSPDELQFLYYLAKRQFTGRGVIVDCGPLAGASTMSFAAAVGGTVPIHVYDLWRFYAGWEEFFPTRPHEPGDDLLPEFLSNLGEFSSSLTIHKGDLTSQVWTGDPIELMFIDAAKTPQIMHRLVSDFFPYLVPGALVVHQDYVSSQCPWIHVAAMMLKDYFEWVDSPFGGTVCARMIRPVPHQFLQSNYYDSLSLDQAQRLINEAAEVCVGWERLCVDLAGATFFISRNQKARGVQVLESVLRHPDYNAFVKRDVEIVDALV